MIQSFRYIPFLLILLFFGCNSKDKQGLDQAKNDSIAKYLKLAENDSLPFVERDKWNEKAFSLIDLRRNDTTVRCFLSRSSYNFIPLKNWKRYKELAKIHYAKSLEHKDTLNLARFYRFRGAYYKNNKIYDSAFYFYVKAEKMYKKTTDKFGLANVLYNKGLIQYEIDDYLGADLSQSKAYIIFKKMNYEKKIIEICNDLGNSNSQLKNFQKGIEYFKEGLKNVEKSKLHKVKILKAYLTGNLGTLYLKKKDYKKALLNYKRALNYPNLKKVDINLYAHLLSKYGYTKLKVKKYDSIPSFFFKVLKIADERKIINESYISRYYLSLYYLEMKDTINSERYVDESLKIARASNIPYNILNSLYIKGIIDKKMSAKCFKEFDEITDSLLFEERKTRSQFFKIQLDVDEIAQERKNAIKQKWLIISMISVVLLIVILLFVIYRQRTKQKESHLFQNQQKANEEIYQLMLNQQTKAEEIRQKEKKRIALELHDGIMNRLASTRLNLFVLSKKTDQETIDKCLKYIEDIHQIESEIRNVSHDLNQELFQEKNSFTTLLNDFIREQNDFSKAKYELQIEESINWELISNEIKMHLYRIIQEASYNCNKYAKATRVVICFTIDVNNLCVSISDNGIGFEPEKANEGIGLLNMQQRIVSLKGSFSVKSKQNKGTILYLKIPI